MIPKPPIDTLLRDTYRKESNAIIKAIEPCLAEFLKICPHKATLGSSIGARYISIIFHQAISPENYKEWEDIINKVPLPFIGEWNVEKNFWGHISGANREYINLKDTYISLD